MLKTNTSLKADPAWLGYPQITDAAVCEALASWTGSIILTSADPVSGTAESELIQGITGLTGRCPEVRHADAAWLQGVRLAVAGTDASVAQLLEAQNAAVPEGDSFVIARPDAHRVLVAGGTPRGLLYGVFALLRGMRAGGPAAGSVHSEAPAAQLRMLNQWDNMDGSIERGYAGESIFYKDGKICEDLTRVAGYARLLASAGINGIVINNVNVRNYAIELITDRYLSDVNRISGVFAAYGISVFMSINYAAPVLIGGMTTADPLEDAVAAWWKQTVDNIYARVTNFGGFMVKADSEFQAGPLTYGRDHADGANVLADALAPHGGLVVWRCFVYNCRQDWRDTETDRARAAFDIYKPLDGKFRDNVILQIKNGPMDFQVREPVSTLFGGLEKTNIMLELQIAQEYTGQQKHVCWLIPQWKEVLDFDTRVGGKAAPVRDITTGRVFPQTHSGIAAVSNIGNDLNWTGHLLAQANLYGFARLTWNPCLSAETLAEEWIAQTFGDNTAVAEVVRHILNTSWMNYEKYTTPLGIGWMINPSHHYGPNVEGYEYSHWGTYHRASHEAIGVDRTTHGGTGYTAQYMPEVQAMYDNRETCPEELLLFFHRVKYTDVLKSGKTLIQHIYDTHFEGCAAVEDYLEKWKGLDGELETTRYQNVKERLEIQLESAQEWRDVINSYFWRKSGIPDAAGRRLY